MNPVQLILIASLLLLTACTPGKSELSPLRNVDPEHPEVCTPERSVSLDIRQITASPMRYHLACVTVTGLSSGAASREVISLSEKVSDIYRSDETVYERQTDSGSLAIFTRFYGTALPVYRKLTVTGMLMDCATAGRISRVRNSTLTATSAAATGEPEYYMSFFGGFCHYSAGPSIFPSFVVVHPEQPMPRLLPSDRKPGVGNLFEAPQDWRHRSRIEALVQKFLVALRDGNRRELFALHVRLESEGYSDDEGNDYAELFTGYRTPFVMLRELVSNPQIFIAPWSRGFYAREFDPAGSDYSSLVCFCLERDCSNLWPIHSNDADNRRGRPYACLSVEQEFPAQPNERPVINIISQAEYGMDEPSWTSAP